MTQYADFMEILGWAVLHSLWQGALALGLVLAARRWAGPNRPHLAYLAGVLGLVATFGAFLATLAWYIGNAAPGTPNAVEGFMALTLSGGASLTPATAAAAPSAGFDWAATVPWLGLVWSVGFFALSLQCMYAWAKTRCYATIGLSEPASEWTQRFARLVERSGVSQSVRLKVSALVESPVTLGTLKPVVLVPAGFLSGFPPAEVEAILLHEIAHIRRHDFLVGLLQTAIRTTLYFNPAVRLMSRLVDEDREQACDDFAVATSGSSIDLAKGLAKLRLSLAPAPVMAANDAKGGPLMARLNRLVGRPVEARGLDRVTALGLSVVVIGATALASNSWAHPIKGEDSKNSYVLRDTVVMPEPPEPPAAPDFPATPVIPPVPPLPFSADEFEGGMEAFEERMEAWGESMEEWGEAFGEEMENNWGPAFEARMEAWAEEMEEWGASLEDQGEIFEDLDDMSDEELAEMGLTRDDVELAAEDFGLTVAEGVVTSLFGGAIDAEARAEIAKERAKLDLDRLEEVKSKLAAEMKDRRARDLAYAERDRAYAERDKLYAERDRKRALRDAERAERDRLRAERDVRREAERAAHMAENAFDAKEVSETLLNMLKRDDIIDADANGYVFKSSPEWTKVNGKRLSAPIHKQYRAYLEAENMGEDADLGLEVTRRKVELELRDGKSTTRVTMNE